MAIDEDEVGLGLGNMKLRDQAASTLTSRRKRLLPGGRYFINDA